MDQGIALQILKAGKNTFITGSAGTGKSYLINTYIQYLKERAVPVAITASTGIAATHVGGQTIHSWSGIGIRETITNDDLNKISKNKQTVSRLRTVRVLIIDEVSMLSGHVLNGVSEILKHFKKSNEPFGGIQVILSGDFYQLPPVSKKALPSREKFAFMAPIWVQAKFCICYLTKQYRQGMDTLTYLLGEIRTQDVSEDSLNHIREKLAEDNQNESAIKLYTHNADVDSINLLKLKQNPNTPRTFYAETKGQGKMIESLKQAVLTEAELVLKQDARVMFVKNNPDKGYFNGSLGSISGFDKEEGHPYVALDSGSTILASPEDWTVNDENNNVLASFRQVPLRLAWAITVHKSQGMTLDYAEIDLSKTFEAGQGYVALSRLRSWEGLTLLGINQYSLALDALAVKADRRFQELSEEGEDWVNETGDSELEQMAREFVFRCGGTLDPEKMLANLNKKQQYAKRTKKESTYSVTLKMLEENKSLEEIAKIRDITVNTVIGHLQKLKEQNPSLDIDRFRPKLETIRKVEKVSQQLMKEADEVNLDSQGRVKLNAIHRSLNGKVSYEMIKLCLLFADPTYNEGEAKLESDY